jgi:hypothetical protein
MPVTTEALCLRLAREARQAQVRGPRRPAVAGGDNVVNLESGVVVLPGHAAVFAAVPGPSQNHLSQRAIHACSVCFRHTVTRAALEGATSLGLDDAKEATDAAVRLDLGLLIGGERACAPWRRACACGPCRRG